jgi:hypothetical protein
VRDSVESSGVAYDENFFNIIYENCLNDLTPFNENKKKRQK